MNAARRKTLNSIKEALDQIASQLEAVGEEEQESRDCLPENLQDGERADKMDENVCSIEEAADEIRNAMDQIEEIING